MKILYVCDALAICGGLERVLIEKANWLVEHGHCEVHLLTVNQGTHSICFPLHPDVLCDDLNIQFHQQYRVSLWKRPFLNNHLHRVFRKKMHCLVMESAPHVIVCTRLDYIRDILQVKGAIPLVFESHASCLISHFEGNGLLRRFHVWYLQLSVKKAQMVVALTKADADEWRKLTPKVCVIPNMVHLNNSNTYSDCAAKSVIFVGRFSKQKDICSLLRIWSLVHQRQPDWILHFYGGYGEEQTALHREMKQMGVNIIIHEATSDIMEKYKESSIMLLTSLYEPFGLVLPEAMSCGLPVVAFDCPYGPADIITDGVDGFLIRYRSIEDFVDKVCLLMENHELRVKMGKAGIVSSMRYDASKIMPLWKGFFEQFVEK